MTQKNKNTGYGMEAPAMDQVRELLFGAQIKEMDSRMQRQEERFERTLEDAKSSFKNRLDTLENFMKSEVASLLLRIKEEQEERETTFKREQRERQESCTTLSRELSANCEETDRKLAKLSSVLDSTERELRALLLAENNSLSNQMNEKYQDVLSALRATNSEIRFDMVHRASLASLFTETALKLNGQWTVDVNQGELIPVDAGEKATDEPATKK